MNKLLIPACAWILFLATPTLFCQTKVVDEIYAVVNDEIITLNELQQFERYSLLEMQSRLQGEELYKAQQELHKNVMNMMINQKLLQSKLKEKNYNVDPEFDKWLQDIKKENNINSDQDLKEAIESQGEEFTKWKERIKEAIKVQRLKMDEIGSKVKIENSQIMEYYRGHEDRFTLPEEITLNAIYLPKMEGPDTQNELRNTILSSINKENFAILAKEHSQLPDAESTPFLGKFKKGELDKALDEETSRMKPGEISPAWVNTENGWYLLQLVERVESRLRPYGEVKDEIEYILRDEYENEKLGEYIEQLKKEAYIRILKNYPENQAKENGIP